MTLLAWLYILIALETTLLFMGSIWWLIEGPRRKTKNAFLNTEKYIEQIKLEYLNKIEKKKDAQRQRFLVSLRKSIGIDLFSICKVGKSTTYNSLYPIYIDSYTLWGDFGYSDDSVLFLLEPDRMITGIYHNAVEALIELDKIKQNKP